MTNLTTEQTIAYQNLDHDLKANAQAEDLTVLETIFLNGFHNDSEFLEDVEPRSIDDDQYSGIVSSLIKKEIITRWVDKESYEEDQIILNLSATGRKITGF